MIKGNAYIILLLLLVGCGISKDCFKGNGNKIVQSYSLEGFTKIKVHEGVGLVIKQGPIYNVKVETNAKILENLSFIIENDMLIIKDNSTCNIARDYGQTIVYITTPNLTEIHSKTNQNIESDGILTFSDIKLFSLDETDGSGTGDFYLNLYSNFIYVESNTGSNYYLSGETYDMNVFFSWGTGRFQGENLKVTHLVSFFHRGSNDIILFPLNDVEGGIYATGNVILNNNPAGNINVSEYFNGKLILNY